MATAVRLGGYLATLALVAAMAWGFGALLGRDVPGSPVRSPTAPRRAARARRAPT